MTYYMHTGAMQILKHWVLTYFLKRDTGVGSHRETAVLQG